MSVKKFENTEEAVRHFEALLTEKESALEELRTELSNKQVEASNQKTKELEDKITSIETQLETVQADRDAKAEELKTVTAERDEVKANLEKIETEHKVEARLAKLEKLGIEVTADRKEKFEKMSDDAFDIFAEEMEARLKDSVINPQKPEEGEKNKEDDNSEEEDDTNTSNLDVEEEDDKEDDAEVEASLGKNELRPGKLLAEGLLASRRKSKK